MLPIRQRNNWTIFVALIFIVMSVLRIPSGEGLFRAMFQLVVETGVLFTLAALIYFHVNKWVGLFLALSLISTIYPSFGKWSMMARNAIVIGCVWYTLLIITVKNPKYLLNSICVISLLNIIFATFQCFGSDPYGFFSFGLMKGVCGDPTGLMCNKNLLSAIIAFSVPAFYRGNWRWFVPVVFCGLTIADSSGGALAAVVMTVGYFFFKDGRDAFSKNSWAILFLALWFCHFAFVIDPPATVEVVKKETTEGAYKDNVSTTTVSGGITKRIETYKTGIKIYQQRPFMGFGIGHWKLVFKKMAQPGTSVMVQAHNEFIQGLFEMGILFVVILLGYFIYIIRTYKREAILSVTALGIIAVNSMVNFPFHVAPTAIMAVTWMAVFEIQTRRQL